MGAVKQPIFSPKLGEKRPENNLDKNLLRKPPYFMGFLQLLM
jgi:hypothetical protein